MCSQEIGKCSDKWGSAENKTKHRSRIRSTKQGFVKKNVRGFRFKPRGDWFSFAVKKAWFSRDYHILLFSYSPTPRNRVEYFLWWMDALFWASKARPLFAAIIRLWRARTFFNITQNIFIWKKSNLHLGGWENHGVIFIFGWTIPLKRKFSERFLLWKLLDMLSAH